jgi:WD40 repeat protein
LAVLPYELDEVQIYDAEKHQLAAQIPITNPTTIAFSPHGRHVAVDSLNNVLIFDVQTQRPVQTLVGHTSTVYSIAFSPDGKVVATAGGDRSVRMWSMAGVLLTTLTGHLADATEVCFSPDGRTLLSADDRGVIDVTHVATRQSLFELPVPAEQLRSMAISPDSKRLAAIRTLRGDPEIVVLGPP